MNKENNWSEVLRIANDDLTKRNGRHIHVKRQDDGQYSIIVDGETFIENLSDKNLSDCIEVAHDKASKMPKMTLEEMVSDDTFKKISDEVKHYVGKEAFPIVFPAIKKAIEEGSGSSREEILGVWLDIDSVRICSHCGAIMQEGWYLDCCGYACSDECAKEIMKVPDMEHFYRYRIYKEDIDSYLEDEGEGRKEEDLTQEEIEEILDELNEYLDACYTEWY